MKRRLCLALIVAFVAALLGTPAAFAAEFRGDTTITIGEGEVLNDDLYLFATTITIDGTINGDVFAVGSSVTINGTVNGNVYLAGENVTLSGTVSQDARVVGNTVTVAGSIGDDLLVLSNSATVLNGASIGRDLILAVSSTTFDGDVGRRIAGVADTLILSGTVAAEVDVDSGTLTITDGASIGGDLSYRSDSEAEIASGAQIGGDLIHEMPGPESVAGLEFDPVSWGWSIVSLLMAAVYGTFLLFAFPRLTLSASNQLLESPLLSIGMGIVFLIVVPIAATLVMITVIGIPLGLITLLVYGIALFSAQVFVGVTIGRLLFSFFANANRRLIQFFGLLLGLLVLFGISFIPYVGSWSPLVIAILGLGGLMVAIGKLRNMPPQAAAHAPEG